MRRTTGGWMAAALLAGVICHAQTAYGVLLRNGRIVDGTGAPWYRGDVGVRAGKIAAIGRLEGARAARVIDVSGESCPAAIWPGQLCRAGISPLGSAECGLTAREPPQRTNWYLVRPVLCLGTMPPLGPAYIRDAKAVRCYCGHMGA